MIDTETKFLISVAPLTRIPLSRDQSFFYTSDSQIMRGSLVEIPIGRRSAKGIVTDCHADFARAGGITLKKVHKVLQPAFLTHEQIALAHFMTTQYYISLGIVLKQFVPDRIHARNTHKPLPLTTLKPLALQRDAATICDEVGTLIEQKKSPLLQTSYTHSVKESITYIIQNFLAKDPESTDQILILVPERTHISMLEALIHETFPQNITTTLSSTMTKGQYYESWERIRSKNDQSIRIIIGTRVSVCAPFTSLGLIIVTNAHDMSYKQWEMNPRYDARACAQELATLHNCSTLSLSASPKITQFATAKENGLLLKLPHHKKPHVTHVDMKIEYNEINEKRYTKSHPALSRILITEIIKSVQSKKQIFLFINRQGKSAFSVCENCKTVARCPTCERALIENNRGSNKCLHCSFVSIIFPKCSSCGSLKFKTVGLGTEKVEEEVRKIVPHARIARVDSDTMKKRAAYETLYRDSAAGTIDIVIGTQMATKGWSLPRLSLVGIIDMDTLLGGTNFDTHENAYAHIIQLGSRLSQAQNTTPKLIIQAYDTLHEVLRGALERDPLRAWENFIEEEMSMRAILHFPPFATLIKLTYQNTDKKILSQEASILYEKISSACQEENSVKITEPHDPQLHKIRTKYRTQIILKIKKGVGNEKAIIPRALHEILTTLDHHWIIDVDPIQLS